MGARGTQASAAGRRWIEHRQLPAPATGGEHGGESAAWEVGEEWGRNNAARGCTVDARVLEDIHSLRELAPESGLRYPTARSTQLRLAECLAFGSAREAELYAHREAYVHAVAHPGSTRARGREEAEGEWMRPWVGAVADAGVKRAAARRLAGVAED